MKIERLRVTVTFAIILAIVLMVFSFVHSSQKIFVNQAGYGLEQEAQEKAIQFENSLQYAYSSIKLVSQFASANMTQRELLNPNEVLAEYSEKTPFDFIEYIRWDGINTMNSTPGAKPFDASDREYYINGIKGKSGIWINYTPKASKEVLVNFYTPLYYNGEVAGVLTGTLGGNSSFQKKLEVEFNGQLVNAFVCDENFKVISSTTQDIRSGLCIADYVDNPFIYQIIKHAEDNDTDFFRYKEDHKSGISTVVNIPGVDWKIVMIVLPRTLSASMQEISSKIVIIVLLVVAIVVLFIAVQIYFNKRAEKKVKEEEYIEELLDRQSTQISILSSLAGIYHTSHLLDLKKNMVVEIKSPRFMRDFVTSVDNAAEQMKNVMKHTVSPGYLDEVIAFSDLTTVAKRLGDKKIISTEFLGNYNGWTRASFIPVEYDEKGEVFKVLFVTQVIDNEKRREEKLINSAYNDELTGLYNRRAYEDDLRSYREKIPEDDYVYVSFDVNGLKGVNDNLGHEAGDELIRGAADCLTKAFGSYGKVYRTGGDEFQAIIFVKPALLEDIKANFDKIVTEWVGKLVPELRISAGYVTKAESLTLSVSEIVKLADQRMYKAKSLYYTSRGVDRRGQQAAFEVLCQSYTKILKVNLASDEYSIITMDSEEKDVVKGFSESISAWFHNFAMSGQVHQDDVNMFLKNTDIEAIKSHFASNNATLSFQYRRNIRNVFCKVMMEMIPAKDYSQENQIIYLYVKNIE